MTTDESAEWSSNQTVTLPEEPELSRVERNALADPRLFAPLRDPDFLLAAARALLAHGDNRGLWDLDYFCKEKKEGRLEAAQRALAGGDHTVVASLRAAHACLLKNTVRPRAVLQ